MLGLQHPQYPNRAEDGRVAAYPWPVFRMGLFFSCEGKHYNVLDIDSYGLEGHNPGRCERVLVACTDLGHYQPRLEILLG